jgi:6-pyruvoyltetrahydropterin/6-carboxytetrahydropterin synthase
MYELSKQFLFDAAHTLHRKIETESSLRIHGHSYKAVVTLRGRPDPVTGMIMDVGKLEQELRAARDGLDHRFLDEIEGLGPATLENLCRWIWNKLEPGLPALCKVSVSRPSNGDSCSYWGEGGQE